MSEETCSCSNLNDSEVKKRKMVGYASLVAAFGLVYLNKVQAPPAWVLATPAVPFFFGYLGLLQARSRTCVGLAFVDRDMSEGKLSPVSDREVAWRLKKRSGKIIAQAAVAAALSAALCAVV